MGHSLQTQNVFTEARMRDAMAGDSDACFELGVSYSAGTDGYPLDLIAAHKWFNIAALGGNDRAMECRAEIAEEMSAREIIEAQRQARTLLAVTVRHAA
jgi:TPR repeat protein